MKIDALPENVVEEISKIFGNFYTGSQLTSLLEKSSFPTGDSTWTKWRRLNDIFSNYQQHYHCSNQIFRFIQCSTDPVLFVNKESDFHDLLFELNKILAFVGFFINDKNQIIKTSKSDTIPDAMRRASELRSILSQRNIHPDVLKYCKPELLNNNYFHAVLESTKSVSDKIRNLSGLISDGASLVDEAFSLKNPVLAINSLRTESEQSEQKGFSNLLKGIFGMFRNTTAHAPKINWDISKADAIDLMTTLSFIHRKLDDSIKIPKFK